MSRYQVQNCWDNLTHFIDGVEVKPGVNIVIAVRWPDGTETKEVTEWDQRTVMTYDHGHEYPTKQNRIGVKYMFRGIEHFVTLDKLEVL